MKYLKLLFLVSCFLLNEDIYCQINRQRRVSDLREYRQLDSNGQLSFFITKILCNGHVAHLIYTDVDILIKANRWAKDDWPQYYQFLTKNKKYFKVYRDIKNNGISVTFKDSIIGGDLTPRNVYIYPNSSLRKLFVTVDKDYNFESYQSDNSRKQKKLESFRKQLLKVAEDYYNTGQYTISFCDTDGPYKKYPNYVVLHFDYIEGMEVLYYDSYNIDNIDFTNKYFRDLVDLFVEICRKNNLKKIIATVPVLK